VLAIVNRSGSDLCDKAHGVLFTSDGRDIEMSVASTKAFYAQIAAGFVWRSRSRRSSASRPRVEHEVLSALRALPDAMRKVLARREQIARPPRGAAQSGARGRSSATARTASRAEEIRIKLSELCYKSIACDATEDKKHIDLSSEPMILVCASGSVGLDRGRRRQGGRDLQGAQGRADRDRDRGREPVRRRARGRSRSGRAPFARVRAVGGRGHLFGYACALAIDSLARPLREARAAIESLVSHPGQGSPFRQLEPRLRAAAARFFADLRQGLYDGALEARTAVQVASLLRYVQGLVPLESYEAEPARPARRAS
jgi:glucosamine--fructose-6-phosphate aminotransferase (isomerizing)